MRRLASCAVPLVLVSSFATAPARAQDTTAPAQIQSHAQTQASFSEAQIEQLVAPIALYPDPLLMQILMASTYPLEVIEAARWSHDNSGVKGTALQDAMQSQSWDPSVKALTAVPQTLEMMNDKLDWTQQLGDAFLAQQQDVLDAVQKLRAEAQAAGNLQSTPQQVVTTAPTPTDVVASGAPRPIVIEPVNPNVYYFPVYNPAVVYGGWDYPAYPPFYWSPPGFVASNVVSFTAGIAVGAAIWGGCDWWNHNVIINVNRYNIFNHANIDITDNTWIHNPAHRHDVPYPNASVAQRFGRANEAAARDAFRNRADAHHGDFFGNRANPQHDGVLGNRADIQRPDAFRRTEGDADDAARRSAPALPERPEGEFRQNGDERRADRAMPERRDLEPPRDEARWEAMRSRAQVFRPWGTRHVWR
ncbi:DUF3300 domain-containing protein [Bradyrhizobium sp. WSM 1738]|nr:DUF3300 domain-containing protein [Bradyrhizobium hereditatis]